MVSELYVAEPAGDKVSAAGAMAVGIIMVWLCLVLLCLVRQGMRDEAARVEPWGPSLRWLKAQVGGQSNSIGLQMCV